MTDKPITTSWKDKQASKPNPLAMAVSRWNLNGNLPDLERMERAIESYEDASVYANECDEPGCTKESSCGWPTEGGYRRTCYDHWKK